MTTHQSNPIIFIVGPTAVGKTSLAIDLAEELGAEIVSCDAMQVYKEINIASAKPSVKDLKRVPHHAINLVSVTESFNVAQFRTVACLAIEDIHNRRKPVFVVGGSGMYMSVLLDGLFEGAPLDQKFRQEIEQEIETKGSKAMHERLKQLDPRAALKIHENDSKRIIRALEVVLTSHQPISELQQKREGLWGKYPIKIIGLQRDREEMYKRAEIRIDQMFDNGLIDEVRKATQLKLSPTAYTLIGVREVMGYLQGQYDLDKAKYLMKLNTRHYIKRQMTWFNREKRIEWLGLSDSPKDDLGKLLRIVKK